MKKIFFFLIALLPVVAILVLNMTISIVAETVDIPVDKISFSQNTIITGLGETIKLSPTITPTNASNKDLVWASSNQDVVVVTPLGEASFIDFGSAYVTATTLDGNKSASMYFIITDTAVHRLVIYTNEDKQSVKVGESLQVYSQVLPLEAENKNVSFFSSDTTVATINEHGKIEGHSAGVTTIVGTTQDGGYIDSMEIEVYEGITSMSLPSYILSETSSYTLNLNIQPASALITKVNLTSDKTLTANVDSYGNVVFSQAGIVNITAEYEDIKISTKIEYTNGYASSLTVNESTKIINYSERVWQIDYQTTPQNLYNTEVSFISSNHNVATVNNTGLVQLEGGGASVISVITQKSDQSQIVREIVLFVERDITSIITENVTTALNQTKLNFTALPVDSTTTDFYFTTNSSIASVDNQGNVTFLEKGQADITIFAQSENSSVFKTVTVTYTGGYATDFEISKNLTIEANTNILLQPNYYPLDTTIKNIEFEVVSQNANDNTSDDVVWVSQSGVVNALKGGQAQVKATLEIENLQYVSKIINIDVIQHATEIKFDIDLETLNNIYISGKQTVDFSAFVLPNHTTDKSIQFNISKNSAAATLLDNKIVFNYPATITLQAINPASNIISEIEIRYTNTILKVDFKPFPTEIYVGQSAFVEIESYLPSNLASEISLRKNNEQSKANGSVVSLSNNQIVGVNGGVADLAVYVAGLYQTSFSVNVVRLGQSLEVYPANVQISANSINLSHTIYPIDTTTTEIVWQISNLTIANIADSILQFNDYGLVEITATINDENQASFTFTIEKVVSSPEYVSPTEEEIDMFVGQSLQLSKEQNQTVEYEIVSENGQNIIEINSAGIVRALSAGQAELKYHIYNQFGVLLNSYNITIKVYETVKQINLSNQSFHFYNGEYLTAASHNQLNYSLIPSQNIKPNVNFELLDTTIASIEDNTLIFYSEGMVRLKGVSEDQSTTNIWTIRYTGGYARDFVLNSDSVINIAKDQSKLLEITNWIPFNTTNKNILIQTLSQETLDFVRIEGSLITALKGGTVQLLLRVSDILTKTLIVNVTENLEKIEFNNKHVITSEITYLLTPTITPSSATNKDIIFEVDNTLIATVTNNVVTFNIPGTVNIKAKSVANPLIFDTIEITSTAGYPSSITLNASDISLFTGESFNLLLSSFTPNTIGYVEVQYDIVEEMKQTQNQVIILDQSGLIKAVSPGYVVIRASVANPYQLDISKLVYVNVVPVTNNLKVEFDSSISSYNNMYITGQKDVDFTVLSLPTNLVTKNYQILTSQQDIATVTKGNISFLKTGIVNITFISLVNPSVRVQISVNYVNNSYLFVEVDESNFTATNGKKQISLPVETIYQFNIIKTLPTNIQNQNVVITEINSYPNSPLLPVAQILNNKISLVNGGKVEVNLTINGYNLGNYTFEVIRKATQINVENTQIFTAVPYYAISAKLLPADTSNKTIRYTSSDPAIATVNAAGQVEFVSTGDVVITLISDASNLSKTISIRYTRQIQSITFAKQKEVLSINSTLLLEPTVFPTGIDGYKIAYVSDNIQIAIVNQSGRIVTNSIEGVVNITAYIEGNASVSATIQITVVRYITNIALELDEVDDDRGIAGKRVFGNLFYTSSNEIVSTYQMNIFNINPANSQDILVWSSSNPDVATVNQQGLVTFYTAGIVTIRVQPQNQYNINRPVYDSYTFTVVEGINIYNFEQFVLSMERVHLTAAVLQADAIISSSIINKYSLKDIKINSDIHGNGHLLSLAGLNGGESKLTIIKPNITIDNVRIRGENMGAGSTLDDMVNSTTLILIWHTSNVVIKNSFLENAYTLVRVFGSKVQISGTIFQNAGFSHIHISHTADSEHQSVLTVKNTVYKDAIIAAIAFDFDQSKTNEYQSKLFVEGVFLVYNFRQASDFMSPSLLAKVPEMLRGILTSNASELLSFINYIKHTHNQKEYYNIAILAIDLNYVIDSKKSPGTVDITKITTNYYRLYEASNNIPALSVTLRIYTIMPGNNSITPSSTFDSSIYKTIREN